VNDHKTAVSCQSANPTAEHHKSNLELASSMNKADQQGDGVETTGGTAWACTVLRAE